VSNEIKYGSIKAVMPEECFDIFLTQLVYHKDKRMSLAMSKLIEITLKHSVNWE